MAEKEKGVVKYKTAIGEEVELSTDLVMKYLVQGKSEFVTGSEIMYFMSQCKALGLNPFKRDCWLIKYSKDDNAQIVTSIHKKRAIARKSPDCKGWDSGILIQCEDGSIKKSKGLMLDGEKLVGGYFSATPEGWLVPWELEVNLSAYVKKTKQGAITKFWSPENQPMMIRKVAEAQGLTAMWGESTGDLIAEEEMLPNTADMTLEPDGRGGFAPPDKKPESKPEKVDPVAKLKEMVSDYLGGDEPKITATMSTANIIANLTEVTFPAYCESGVRDFPKFLKTIEAYKNSFNKPKEPKDTKKTKPVNPLGQFTSAIIDTQDYDSLVETQGMHPEIYKKVRGNFPKNIDNAEDLRGLIAAVDIAVDLMIDAETKAAKKEMDGEF